MRAVYEISSPDITPHLVSEKNCQPKAAMEWRDFKTRTGTEVNATFCFNAAVADSGQLVIPYRVEKESRRWWGADRYSTEVNAYTDMTADAFRPSQADERILDEARWPARWDKVKEAAQWILGGLGALWLFTVITGWVIRGFFSIPAGQDHRPEPSS